MPPGFPTKLLEGIESLTDRGFRFFQERLSTFVSAPFHVVLAILALPTGLPPLKYQIWSWFHQLGQCYKLSFTQLLLGGRVEHHVLQLLGLDPSTLL